MLVRVVALSLLLAVIAGLICWRKKSWILSWIIMLMTALPWAVSGITDHGEAFFGFLMLLLPASTVCGLIAWRQTVAERRRRPTGISSDRNGDRAPSTEVRAPTPG